MTPRPRAAASRPASNCGLISATRSPRGREGGRSLPMRRADATNDASTTTRSMGTSKSSRWSSRALTRSRTSTRASARSLAASWPSRRRRRRPRAAPRWSRQIGEAAGRGAHVDARLPGDVEAVRGEGRERVLELLAAAQTNRGPEATWTSASSGEQRARACRCGAAPVTLPAIISACASVREPTSTRATSRASARTRVSGASVSAGAREACAAGEGGRTRRRRAPGASPWSARATEARPSPMRGARAQHDLGVQRAQAPLAHGAQDLQPGASLSAASLEAPPHIAVAGRAVEQDIGIQHEQLLDALIDG